MTLRIYDARQAEVVEFRPVHERRVGMYVCGPTVQSSPHIGHLRSALVYDQIRRWFEYRGYSVTLIRNVTDIDDKVLERAQQAQRGGSAEQWWALAYRIELEFAAAYRALAIHAPSYEPRATANIDAMLALIQQLIERGHAYQADDDSANVYFDTASWPSYGELTRQSADALESQSASEGTGKRNIADFALWKAHREGEPADAAWPTPWGLGRPGWHIECSAMAVRYLGTTFDIHGGGLDLRFPHHENELAQSQAAGHEFARYWMHNGLVNVSGQKMSKSLGNSLFASDLLDSARPIVIRYFLGSAHYRSTLEFHQTALDEAEAAFSRVESFLRRAEQSLRSSSLTRDSTESAALEVPEAFAQAMDDDFAIPQALAVLHSRVRDGNTLLDGIDTTRLDELSRVEREVVAMLNALGLNPRDFDDRNSTDDPATAALDRVLEELIAARNEARAAKDFALSDQIRDRLAAAGVVIEDGADGTSWRLDGN